MTELRSHHLMSLNDSSFQPIKSLLAICGVRRLIHLDMSGSFLGLGFDVLQIEEIPHNTKSVFVSTG
ncbi:MAG TPA: hypothetical protein VKH40_13005 [Alloacidobacterium sp.]|nr:hypothetical protein [Alloacidobacterium sp.]